MPSTATQPAPERDDSQALRDLRARLDQRGLLEPSRFWTRKLLFWVPAFFLSYLGLLALPFGLALAAAGAGRLGRSPDDGLRRPRRRALRALQGPLGEQLLGPVRDDVPVRDELRLLALAPQRRTTSTARRWAATPTCTSACCSPSTPSRRTGTRRSGVSSCGSRSGPSGRSPRSTGSRLRYDGIRDLFQRPEETKIDRFLMPLHWIVLLIVPGLVFGWPAALLAYLTVSCLSSLMTASVFIPNHIGMRRLGTGQKVSYLEQQVTTSREHRQPAAARLLLRRAELPDRAPPVPAGRPQPLSRDAPRRPRILAPSAGSPTARSRSTERSPRSATTWAR